MKYVLELNPNVNLENLSYLIRLRICLILIIVR